MKNRKQSAVWAGYYKRDRRWWLVTGILFLLVLFFAAFMMIYGNTIYTPKQIFHVLSGEDLGNANYTILRLRLPRMVSGIFAGLAFGMAGNVFQTVLRNSLASPDIIGVSASTSAAAVFCLSILSIDSTVVPVIAVATGIIVSAGIYVLASKGGFSHGRMILIGIGAQSMVHAFTSWILTRTSEYDVSNTFRWMNGSLNNAEMRETLEMMAVVVLGGTILATFSRNLRVMEIGDEYAQTLGANPSRSYRILIGTSVVLVAFATAVTGPVSSVAFLSGPISAKLTGKSKCGIFPAGLTGALLVLAGDMAGQYAFSQRFPVGIITGLLGAPYLLFLLITINRKGEKIE